MESSVVLVALAAIGIVTALVVVAWRFGSDTPETAIPDFSSQPPAETRAKQPARKPARPAAPIARLTITGALGDSWVEVHQRTAAGRELYRGTLEAGSTIRFAQRRMHVVMGRPGNLRLKVNGRVVEVPGRGNTTAVVITARRVIPVRSPA